MSKVSSQETKFEILVRKYLFSCGFRYRKNDKRYPGKPDIVLSKYKTVVFINGCFWHGHEGCKASKLPVTNKEFWAKKISDNVTRDERNQNNLKKSGWRVIVVWECELNTIAKRKQRLENLVREITL